MTVEEAVRKFGVTRQTVMRWLKVGDVEHIRKLNGRIEIDDASMLRFVSDRLAGAVKRR